MHVHAELCMMASTKLWCPAVPAPACRSSAVLPARRHVTRPFRRVLASATSADHASGMPDRLKCWVQPLLPQRGKRGVCWTYALRKQYKIRPKIDGRRGKSEDAPARGRGCGGGAPAKKTLAILASNAPKKVDFRPIFFRISVFSAVGCLPHTAHAHLLCDSRSC